MIRRFINNPRVYFKRLPLFLTGVYFDLFVKKYSYENLLFSFPIKYTSIYDRGHAWYFGYEKPECLLASENVKENSSVLELGACIGVVSCVANKKLSDPRRHVVVEANQAIIPYLKANRDANNCKFAIENCIVSQRSSVKFFVNKSMVLSGTGRQSDLCVDCQGVSFVELEEKYGLNFDFLIMDIEGGEYNFILENKQILSNKIRSIILETHKDVLGELKVAEYEEALYSIGFKKIKKISNVEYFEKNKLG
jgi:FkbM family methyltransferase